MSLDGSLGRGALQHNADKVTAVKMLTTPVRPKQHHLETLRLKGNTFTPRSVSGLYSWKAFTVNKTKGGKKVDFRKI